MQLRKLIQISRPRFWMYTVGPFLVGIAATWNVLWLYETILSPISYLDNTAILSGILLFLIFLTYLFYFLFPANLLIYGVNDIADGDTDQYNIKKQGYEQRLMDSKRELIISILKRSVVCIIIAALLILGLSINEHYPPVDLPQRANNILPHRTIQSLFTAFLYWVDRLKTLPFWFAFLCTSVFYSLPPIRAKSKPFIDGLFNVLYILPWLIAYITFGWSYETISWIWFGAAWLWCVAMHTYSAIPDITPDRQAWLTTTAALLWPKHTLWYCASLWLLSSLLALGTIWSVALIFGIVYLGLIITSFYKPVMQVYTRFPRVNAIVGFVLFWTVVYI